MTQFGVTWAAIIISVISTFYKFTPIYLSAIDKRISLPAAFLFSSLIFVILLSCGCHQLLLRLLLGFAIICLELHCCSDSATAVFNTSIALGSCEFTITALPPPRNLSVSVPGDVPTSDTLRLPPTSELLLSAEFLLFVLNISNFRWRLETEGRMGGSTSKSVH